MQRAQRVEVNGGALQAGDAAVLTAEVALSEDVDMLLFDLGTV